MLVGVMFSMREVWSMVAGRTRASFSRVFMRRVEMDV